MKYSYHQPGDEQETSYPQKHICSRSCLTFTLHLFNVLFFISGSILTAFGVMGLVFKPPSLVTFLSTMYYDLTWFLMLGIGLIILMTTGLGCSGICRKSRAQILIYAFLMALICLAEASAGILAYMYKNWIDSEIQQGLRETFNEKYGIENQTTAFTDALQTELKCCGIHGFEDWTQSQWYSDYELRGSNKVPDSCCITKSLNCGVRDHPSNIRDTGCLDKIYLIGNRNLMRIGTIAIGICFFQIFGATLAFILYCRLRRSHSLEQLKY